MVYGPSVSIMFWFVWESDFGRFFVLLVLSHHIILKESHLWSEDERISSSMQRNRSFKMKKNLSMRFQWVSLRIIDPIGTNWDQTKFFLRSKSRRRKWRWAYLNVNTRYLWVFEWKKFCQWDPLRITGNHGVNWFQLRPTANFFEVKVLWIGSYFSIQGPSMSWFKPKSCNWLGRDAQTSTL